MTDESRILLWFHHFRTPKDVGGLRSWHIGRALVASGYCVDAVVPGVDSLTGSAREAGRGRKFLWHEEIDGVNISWVKSARNRRASYFGRIVYFVTSALGQLLAASRRRRPILVIAMSVPLSSLVLSWLYARTRGASFIVDVRDTHIDSGIASGFVRESMFVRGCLQVEAWIFRRADLNITVTDGMKRILKRKGVRDERIRTIHLGFDGDGVYDACTDWNRDIKKEIGLSANKVVLYSGSLGNVFDIETILKAARVLADQSDIQFVFLGGGYERQRWEGVALEAGANAIFAGERPKSEVPLFCRAADVAVYAVKDKEALKAIAGNKVFDYLGSGTPIVCACDNGDVADLIKVAKAGEVVASGDYEAMAESVLRLCRDDEYASELGVNGRTFAVNRMNVSRMMEKFVQAVDDTAGVRG